MDIKRRNMTFTMGRGFLHRLKNVPRIFAINRIVGLLFWILVYLKLVLFLQGSIVLSM